MSPRAIRLNRPGHFADHEGMFCPHCGVYVLPSRHFCELVEDECVRCGALRGDEHFEDGLLCKLCVEGRLSGGQT